MGRREIFWGAQKFSGVEKFSGGGVEKFSGRVEKFSGGVEKYSWGLRNLGVVEKFFGGD